MNRSGLMQRKYLIHGFGIPALRHSLTEGGLMSHISATTEVPPSASIVLFANSSMTASLDAPNEKRNTQTENNWSDRLVYAFGLTKLNRTQFGQLVGVSAPTVHDWMHGKIKMIAGDHLVLVCQVLRINPLWLITGQGEMMADDRRQGERRDGDRRLIR